MTAMPNDELSILEIKRLIVDTRKRLDAFGMTEQVVTAPKDYREEALIDVVFMNVYRILEEANSLSFDLKSRYSSVPWDEVRGMRNRFAHDYSHVDRVIVWHTIAHDLSALESVADDYIADNGLPNP